MIQKIFGLIKSLHPFCVVACGFFVQTLVRDELRKLGYYDPNNGISIEEQKSEIAKIKTLLSKASKNDKGNKGYPEFIISNTKDTNFLIVFECKPDVKKHESSERDKAVDYAVDGVLHYTSFLNNFYYLISTTYQNT